MIEALSVLGVLLLGLLLYRRRKIRKPIYHLDEPGVTGSATYSTRSTLPADGDPFDNRIEFHFAKRRE